MEKLFKIKSKRVPSIYDENTIYTISDECNKCGSSYTTIDVLGAYLPTFKNTFGLIESLGGIIGSKEAVEYLKSNNVSRYTLESAIVTFGKRDVKNEEYYWIKPKFEIELNSDKGPGSITTCLNCNMTSWNEKEGINYMTNYIPSDIYLIKNTWRIVCSEKFMEIAKKVPNNCYLDFEEWEFRLDINE